MDRIREEELRFRHGALLNDPLRLCCGPGWRDIVAAEQITSLAALVTPENFKLILRRRFDQVDMVCSPAIRFSRLLLISGSKVRILAHPPTIAAA